MGGRGRRVGRMIMRKRRRKREGKQTIITTRQNEAITNMSLTIFSKQKSGTKKKNTINYHLSRLYPKLSGPQKRK